jgi:hypothetical protein
VARADSTIRVNILGDAKSLQKAAATSEGAVAGLNKKVLAAGAVIGGVFAADQLVDFANTAVKEADRVGDATDRLEGQLGALSEPLIAAADDFARLGASEGDMLDLEARLVDLATEAGLADDAIAALADDAAVTASAMALMTEQPADFWLDQIGKAADGSDRALRDLGISLTDASVEARALADTGKASADSLTEGELAAARYAIILEELQPRIAGITQGSADLEQRQAELNARWETLTGNIGEGLEGPLNDLLGWIITGIDGWALLSDRIGGFDKAMAAALTPVARMIDLQRTLIGLLAEALNLLGQFAQFGVDIATGTGRGTPLPRGGLRAIQGSTGTTNVYVQGGSPETIEQAVRDAVRTTARRG